MAMQIKVYRGLASTLRTRVYENITPDLKHNISMVSHRMSSVKDNNSRGILSTTGTTLVRGTFTPGPTFSGLVQQQIP